MCFFIISVVLACEYDPAFCAKDQEQFCKVEFLPTDVVQSFYNTRSCLRKHQDVISKQCLNYLELEKPSIIEACLTELKTFCGVEPGCFRAHLCLSEVSVDDISLSCQEALDKDEETFLASNVIMETRSDEKGFLLEDDYDDVARKSSPSEYTEESSER